MKYLDDEAIDEIWALLEQVKEVRGMVSSWGIYYHSDCWTAIYTSINPIYVDTKYWEENIFAWNKEDFKAIDISKIHSFNVGGSMSLCTRGIEEEPKQLVQAKADTIEYYLNKIVEDFEGKYFDVSVYAQKPYRDCGWECPIGIIATPLKDKCCRKSTLEEKINNKISDFFDELSKEYDIVINYDDINWDF